VARDPQWLDRFTAAGLPLLDDDLAASALRQRRGGYPAEASPLLKSPPGTPI
jgi:hypothetical protein